MIEIALADGTARCLELVEQYKKLWLLVINTPFSKSWLNPEA
jgi:hypothetical protein